MATRHHLAPDPEAPQPAHSEKPVEGLRRLARQAGSLFSGVLIGVVFGVSFLAATGPPPPSPPPVARQRISLGNRLDLETTDWETAKKLVAYLLNRSPQEIDAREAWQWLRSGRARHAYRDNRDRITWAEAKEVIGDLLGVAKDIIDEKERLQGVEELAGLTTLATKRRR